jgi:hypothetical protein
VKLPAEGRKGAPPQWPLSRAKVAERELWVQLWATPQAAQWERLGVSAARTVARYARLLVAAEKPGALASVQSEVRQMEDRLGLTPMAMLRLQWEVVSDELSEARAEQQQTPTRGRHLNAVDPAAAPAADA